VKFFDMGILLLYSDEKSNFSGAKSPDQQGGLNMDAKGWALTAGLGAAAGAVAILMMPRQNPVRKLAAKTANKAEDLVWKMEDKMNSADM
jgi:hypothetical protein